MNGAHIHLILNHAPVVGAVFATVLLLWGHFRHEEPVRRVALWSFVVLAPMALLVYLTGEPAEDVIEHLPGVESALIEPHEELALVALVAMIVTGLAAGLAVVSERRRARGKTSWGGRWLMPLVLFAALASSALMGATANLGGKIRHAEARADFKK